MGISQWHVDPDPFLMEAWKGAAFAAVLSGVNLYCGELSCVQCSLPCVVGADSGIQSRRRVPAERADGRMKPSLQKRLGIKDAVEESS